VECLYLACAFSVAGVHRFCFLASGRGVSIASARAAGPWLVAAVLLAMIIVLLVTRGRGPRGGED
jgi:TM2 domain-containing membrane protein YozV